jgi:sugar transferase (PEP-CTERM/EpsH1 system associated)
MRVLFIVPYAPNLIRVRPYNLIRALARRGHDLTVLTLWSSEAERDDAEALRPVVADVRAIQLTKMRSYGNCLAALPSATPLQAVYCWQPEMAAQIDELTIPQAGKAPFDVAHVEHLRGARYGLHLKAQKAGLRPPVVWDSVDSISLLFRQATARRRGFFGRWLTRFELGRTERYEGWLVGQFDHTLVTSTNDQRALAELLPKGINRERITVLPNGVDLDYFTVSDAPRHPATLVISGKMSYHANVTMVLHFVNDILPLVWARRPEARLVVVGKDPPTEVQALAADPRITVAGEVPDLRPHLQQATLAVAPIIYGVGIQNKVLEAMACATPVVCTPQAVSALQVQVGRDVLTAQESSAFAEAVLGLLEDADRRQSIGQAGRRYVEVQHQWPVIAEKLENVYRHIPPTGE